MTLSDSRSRLFNMGTVCSSGNKSRRGKGSKNGRTSMTSSSDVAVEVAKSRKTSGGLPPATPGDRTTSASGLHTSSHLSSLGHANPGAKEAPVTPPLESMNSKSIVEKNSASTSKVQTQPQCVAPPQLSRVPPEMQNLLMGRWPVLPTPGSRVLRLFVAGEEAESQIERTWLTKTVFPGLRLYTETLGFHLHVVDTHALLPTPCVPHSQMRNITRQVMNDNIDIWLIFLNSKLGWHLPTTIGAADYTDIHNRLSEKDTSMAHFMSQIYQLDENNIPPVYYLLSESPTFSASHEGCHTRQELFDELCYIVNEEQDELYMTEGFHDEVTTALTHHASMLDNILVVRRTISNLPKDKLHAANQRYEDVDSEGETHQQLLQKHRHLVSRVERIVSNECILKLTAYWPDIEKSLMGQETQYTKSMCKKVEDKLKAAISRMVERQATIDPYLAAGLPPVLCQELLMHAHKQQQLLRSSDTPPDIVYKALDQLHANPTRPIILHGPVGSGLQTISSHLAHEEAKRDCSRMVALRFMTLTPESQTVTAVLFTVLEQVIIGFGGTTTFHSLTDLSSGSILSRMATCTANQSVTVIICGPLWPMLEQKERDAMQITQSLPPNVRVIVVTCSSKLCGSDKSQCLEIPKMLQDSVEQIFLSRLKEQNRCVTSEQHQGVMSVLSKSPMPVLAVLLASLAQEWKSHDVVKHSDIPGTVEEVLIRLLEQAEKVVGRDCVLIILSYLSMAKFGLSESELEDVLAIDTRLMTRLYPKHCPLVRRCPLSIWLYLKQKFAPAINVAYVYGHRVHRWQRLLPGEWILQHYKVNAEQFHSQLADYFSGCWANTPKPLPDPTKNGAMVPVMCSVIEQPDSYDRHTNCRKFLCLLHHMLQGLTGSDSSAQRSSDATKQHLLNLRWLVTKLDATSLVQLLDDLQMAIITTASMSMELSWLQLLVARNASVLSVSGFQLHTCLHTDIESRHMKQDDASVEDEVRQMAFIAAVNKLEQAITRGSVPFLVFSEGPVAKMPSENTKRISGPVDVSPIAPVDDSSVAGGSKNAESCLNGFYANDTYGKQVVSISTLAGEIVVWDTRSNCAVQTLKNINKPSHLVFLDAKRIVVLCNRELKAFDLETGTLISNIRGMLNIKMPYFHVRDAQTVIVLARNRMSVNVLDVNTGQIHATFKAGEDRFLNSLLVSGNGKMLVCGDETQKPFPLLVWELGQSKLLHDLRMPQHEFITSIADITYDGQYVACACKGLYDSANNFVVVYDLMSGQLYRQFRLAASVTAVSVASTTLAVVMTLNDGSLVVYDILSGNCKFFCNGVKAIYNKLELSTDETLAISYSVNAGSMPIACTIAFWNIEIGRFLASYTFDSMVTCCKHVAHNNTILVGLASRRYYVVLSLFQKRALPATPALGTAAAEDKERKISEQQPLWKLV